MQEECNMNKDKFVTKVDKAGHKIDDWAETTAEKHSFPKWKVWLGVVVGILAIVGIGSMVGWF